MFSRGDLTGNTGVSVVEDTGIYLVEVKELSFVVDNQTIQGYPYCSIQDYL